MHIQLANTRYLAQQHVSEQPTGSGKISIAEFSTYVAVRRDVAQAAQKRLASGKIKGKTVRVRLL